MHDMHVDLDLLRALEALVRLRSVTAAGRSIGLTQSATSHALARLRTAFGDALLVRTRTGMVPTAVAEALADRARRILADVEALARTRGEFVPATASRTFGIAMSDGGQLLLLPALLEQLARDAPGIRIAVHPIGPELPHQLETGDVALALGNAGREGDGLYQQKLLEDRLVWVMRRSARTPRRLSLADYVARGRVRIARRGGEPALDRALAAAGLPAPATVTVHSLLAALMIVLRTERVLTTTAETANALASAMPIRVLAPAVAFGTVTIVQQWHARHHGDPAHAWLRQQLKHVVDRRAWVSAPR